MMVIVDCINILTQGRIKGILEDKKWLQYFLAAILGATPGCLGAFMSVSMYVHGIISFGALTACMIATSGDESFVMLAMFPKKALLLFAGLFVLGIFCSYLSDKVFNLFKIKPAAVCEDAALHKEDDCRCFGLKEILYNLRRISFVRFLLLFILASFLYGFISGIIPTDEQWVRFTFIGLLLASVFIVISVPAHYLNEHIWEHIFKKHMGRIFYGHSGLYCWLILDCVFLT